MLFILAIISDKIVPFDPIKADLSTVLLPPSNTHIFGTDNLGRDLFSRVICGLKTSLFSSLIITVFIFVFGMIIGVTAGYYGGIIDDILMKITVILQSFPSLILAIAVAGMLGPSLKNTIIAICIINWTKYARMARSLAISAKESNYIKSALLCGAKGYQIILTDIIPNIASTLLVMAMLDIGGMILEIAGLCFLGLGAQPPTPEWGLMMNEARKYIYNAPWMIIFPGIAILLVVFLFNLLGDELRDRFDIKQ
jgi:peptide/nickel transport system permease protein